MQIDLLVRICYNIGASFGAEINSSHRRGNSRTIRGYVPERGLLINPVDYKKYTAYVTWLTTDPSALGVRTDELTNTAGVYFSAFYNYKNLYSFNFNTRMDASNKFGSRSNERLLPVWSVSGMWNIQETFLKEASWLSEMRLRMSYGMQGNMLDGQTPNMLITQQPINSYYNENVSNVYQFPNPNLKWESTTSWNIGTDLTFLKGRLSANLDVYKKITTDLLVSRELPSLIGYSSVMSNIGEVQNTGVELSLNSTNIRMDKLTWRTSFSLAYNKNKITHLYGIMEDVKDADGNVIGQREADDIKNKRFIGHDIDEIWDYKVVGIWQEEEREEAAKYGQQPGDVHLLDKDMNYKYDNTDKEFQGTTMPRLRWSMRNDFTLFKNFNISFNMYSYIGHKKTLGRFTNDNALLNVTNQIKRDYWTPENRNNEYPRLANKKPAGVSYAIYKNASFLRFDNISIGYTFPKKLIEPLRIQNLNVNATMKNAGYISGWPGYDPENSDANTPRVIYFGINLTL